MDADQRLPVEIAGLSAYLPERVLSNQDLEQMVDTSDEWIFPRTGIRERRIAADDEATSDMALAAAREALQRAELDAAELDAVLVATCTPDYSFPATACLVQAGIGAGNAMACDLEAACSGFLYGLSWASGMIATGMAQNVLLIGAETLSRFTDYTDRRSCILFGDAAGAAVLHRSQNGGEVLYTELGSDGSVFKLAVNKLIELMQRLPERTGIALDDIKMVIPHQSNVRIVNSALERAGLDLDKAYMNIDRVGNTSAASIPLAMAEAVERGELERGDLALLLAFGGGLTWGSVLMRY